jgi:hypothetical protein
MRLCSLNSKSEPENALVAEFSREFGTTDPELLQWAFREHRNRCDFFPTIAQVSGLLRERRAFLMRQEEDRVKAKQAQETEEARAAGQLVDYSEIQQQLLAIVKKFPDSPMKNNLRHVVNDIVKVVPPLSLTGEQIEARKDAERDEINKALLDS